MICPFFRGKRRDTEFTPYVFNVDAVGRPEAKEEMGMPTGTVNVSILHSERKKKVNDQRSSVVVSFLLLGLHFQEKKNV